ncbi:MAG: UvrD-helicase domain-containing protein [Myxococcaceae bacterium]|nr:UvrD-helicase domain-containing protein [Myxococcaceae bacterium]
MAGAGAGKTYSLITICLHLLGGARRDATLVKPAELFLLTFTEKAAGEMRARLRTRVDRLARDPTAADEEKELAASFAREGRPFPPQDFWRRVRDDLGAATIGTFHSLCVQLLRRAPAGFGVDPAFQLLEEGEAARILHDTAERIVLEALEREEPGVVALCRDIPFAGSGRAEGLVDLLCNVFNKVREEGLSPARIPITDEGRARRDFDAAVAQVRDQVQRAIDADLQGRRQFGPVLTRIARGLEGMDVASFLAPDRWPAIRNAIDSEKRLANQREEIKRVKFLLLGKKDEDLIGLHGHYAAWVVAAQEAAFRSLLVTLQARYRAELDKRAVLDFSELLIRTRRLLRDVPDFRREVQGRVRALLVDEFQDTNRLQLELVTLLAERRDGAPRLVQDGDEEPDEGGDGQLGFVALDGRRGRPIPVEEVPLEPGLLAAVGDRKQSIYEFRGADVSVFEVLAKQIERDGGARAFLQTNRRSSPALLDFFNAAFARVMAVREDARDYEVAYVPASDDLRAHRRQRVTPPVVERLIYAPGETAEACRLQDADAVARRLRLLLSEQGGEVVVGEDDVPRRARGGDVAILFRRFTHLELYRQALIRHGVPHRVVRGRGFYGAQEVLDLASLLALVAAPDDGIALAAVLRSPLVALSDASLFQVAWENHQRLSLDGLRQPGRLEGLPADERARLDRLLALYPRLRKERDRLGIRVLLKVALEETGYPVAIAGTPYGEQALANIDKLLELAGQRDAAGMGDCARFARELIALAEAEPDEAQADVLDAGDPRAVQLLTIHRAKGLEWPVVVVPDMAYRNPTPSGRVVFERRLGLAIKPWIGDELEPTPTARHQRAMAELQRREQAESLRILYVALTRARDHLILSGQSPRPARGTWRTILDGLIDDDSGLRGMVRDVLVEEIALPPPAPPAPAEPSERSRARVEQVLTRVRAPTPVQPREVVLPVTQLQDYFLCPRRYLYAHEVGLSEHPMVFEREELPDGEAPDAGGSRSDPRTRGTLAHALLEHVEWEQVRRGGRELRAHLEDVLWAQGASPKDRGHQEILDDVEAFLSTRFAARLAEAGAARVHRELPFLLRIEAQDGFALHVKGKIDLLFEEADGSGLVLDYKLSRRHPAGLEPYAFQLDCYALAARQYVHEGVPVSTGIAFLKEGRREPDLRPVADVDPRELSRRLVEGARALLEHSRRFEWPGQPRERCQNIRCGFQYRCHPE